MSNAPVNVREVVKGVMSSAVCVESKTRQLTKNTRYKVYEALGSETHIQLLIHTSTGPEIVPEIVPILDGSSW